MGLISAHNTARKKAYVMRRMDFVLMGDQWPGTCPERVLRLLVEDFFQSGFDLWLGMHAYQLIHHLAASENEKRGYG